MESNERQSRSIREVYKTPQFEEFYSTLPLKVQTKFNYVIDVVMTIYNISTKFVKHLQNTDLYEMRISVGSNEYRTILFAIDNTNVIEATKIILLNGFLKKSNKDYRKQIEIAQSILNDLEQ
ncbi:MAG: type II toxin-antitoxin system RelE/ParE family toxin [Muribaculaceae bacterium]|nr:type II toxin-antitoxin system RelE/ParE family toxin [Muribaculaceae bacterium]